MFSPTKTGATLCEQCGAKLPPGDEENGCLHCLLTGGLEITDPTAKTSPNEYNTGFYQHYEILSRPDGNPWELGRGAMGVTYKARDIHLNTPVALKLINARFALRPDAQRRFLREAQAAACLRHPNVASVFHFGTTNDFPVVTERISGRAIDDSGDCFYAMEFVEGETLAARLKRRGPLSPQTALALGVQVSRALSAAEHRGLIHRDLKPANIMLTSAEAGNETGPPGEGWVKVIDFGLAKLAHDIEGPTGRFIGTRAFASPEQVQSRRVDSRADIYSLGATLWYSLTGKLPPRPDPSVLPERQATAPPASPVRLKQRNLPASLVALLESAVALNPDDRPKTALEFGLKLQNCLDELVTPPPPRKFPRRRTAQPWLVAAAAVMVGVGVLTALLTAFSSKHLPVKERSIAVLPFRNLGNDPADTKFAQRLQSDLLSRLDKIHRLRITNLVGASNYSDKTGKDLRERGRVFGVPHVLEASLRRARNHVYLHMALVDTRDGHELWAEGYDRSLVDAIALRGDLATDIADALDATLSLEENNGLNSAPPSKPDAHELYLRGRKFEKTLTFAIADYEAAEMLYSQAIALDPRFALAHARLASTLGLLYAFRGPSEELRSRAYAAAREALRLQPDLGEARVVRAFCTYRLSDDLDQARIQLEQARRLLPNDTEASSGLAAIALRHGAWQEARLEMQRCLAREPENLTYQEELYTTAYIVRDWPAAEANATALVTLAPDQPLAKAEKAMVELWRNGDVQPLQDVLAEMPSYGDAEGILTWMRWDAAMIARDPRAARTAIDRFPFETLSSVYGAPMSKSYLEGCLALATGDSELAQKKFELCRPAYEAETFACPKNALRHARLGLLYAYLGRREDAIREGLQALTLKPTSSDHIEGPRYQANLALIYARLGEYDQAIGLVRSLLHTPGSVFFGEASITLSELRLRWQWDPLRNDPRFKAILADPEPATTY